MEYIVPSHILYTHIHRGRILFKRAVLKLYSCPCALIFHLRCGWMEDRAKCFYLSASILRSVRKDLLTNRKERERESRKKSSRFHSIQGCLQCCSLRGANETKVKRILRVEFYFFFPHIWVSVCFVLLLAGQVFSPTLLKRPVCYESCSNSVLHTLLSLSHTHSYYGWLAHS